MLRHYLTIAFRILWRHKSYTLINLLGLATGMACCLLILLFIQFEYSHDRFHAGSDHIYRVVQEFDGSSDNRFSGTGMQMVPRMVEDFPAVEAGVRCKQQSVRVSTTAATDNRSFREDQLLFADSNFFQFFSFPLLEGQPDQVLNPHHGVVLTASAAKKYFEDQPALGQTLLLDGEVPLTVTGIAADPPANSHLQFELVVALPAMYPVFGSVYGEDEFDSWWWPAVSSYLRFRPETGPELLTDSTLNAFARRHREPHVEVFPRLQGLNQIRLDGNPGEGSRSLLYLFGGIGLVVLLIACINFMNLTTARSSNRALEVGVRKVAGASRTRLIRQFLGESFLLTAMALLLGLGLAELGLPLLNHLAGLKLALPLGESWLWGALLALWLTVGLVAGSYPAFFLSRFVPVKVLKQSLGNRGQGGRLRQFLVGVQFVLSVSLIIGTLGIYRQHQFLLGKALGFDESQVVNVALNEVTSSKWEVIKGTFENLASVQQVSASSWGPGMTQIISFPCQIENEQGEMAQVESPSIIYADGDFFETLAPTLKAGRFFTEAEGLAETSFLVNEKALSFIPGDGPFLNRRIRIYYMEYGRVLYEKEGRIVGVLKDFHFQDLRQPIGPLIVTRFGRRDWHYLYTLMLRLKPGDLRDTMARLEAAWKEVFPNEPFEYSFAESRIEAAYEQEARLGQVFGLFAGLAIFIACLGLLGLAAFTAQQRTKEIGVRKALGASSGQVLLLLNGQFTRLVLWALLLALPLGYLLTDQLLASYPFRPGFAWWPYLLAALTALLVAWGTVALHAWRAAQTDPARALRDE